MIKIPERVCERSLYIGDRDTDSNCLILEIGLLKKRPILVNKMAIKRHGMISQGWIMQTVTKNVISLAKISTQIMAVSMIVESM